MASMPWQNTVVVPTLNCEPDFGRQLTDTGAVPPLNVGSVNRTIPFPPLSLSITGSIVGHLNVRGSGDG
jgi:hypothetical protein